ncbi:MAG: hypothetical protein JWN83_1249 [Chitinophagaceae bacterium]|nr:hypothetical protein [Chitinophagaceae bacterium]
MKKILLIATFFVAAYAVKAQGNGSPVPTPGTHVNADDITYTITTAIHGGNHGNGEGGSATLLIEGYFVGLGSSAKVTTPPTINYYSIDATFTVHRDCGPNPGGNFPPGLSHDKTKAVAVGSTPITRNGRMPWSLSLHANGLFCPPPFVGATYSYEFSVEEGDEGFKVNNHWVPLK